MPPEFTLTVATDENTLFRNDRPLVDLIDSLLNHGVFIRGEAVLSVADVDLVFLGVDLVLANPDTMQRKGAGEC